MWHKTIEILVYMVKVHHKMFGTRLSKMKIKPREVFAESKKEKHALMV